MNAARNNILARIHAAVRVTTTPPVPPIDSPIWPPVGDLEQRFRQEFTALRGEIIDSVAGFDGNPEVGITGCDCLVGRTGSIILSTRSGGGRVPSVLPPIHLVLARRDQIVPDLDAAVRLLRSRYDGHWPSFLTVISGPSRTSDIEKVLVLGAHGPKRLLLHFTA